MKIENFNKTFSKYTSCYNLFSQIGLDPQKTYYVFRQSSGKLETDGTIDDLNLHYKNMLSYVKKVNCKYNINTNVINIHIYGKRVNTLCIVDEPLTKLEFLARISTGKKLNQILEQQSLEHKRRLEVDTPKKVLDVLTRLGYQYERLETNRPFSHNLEDDYFNSTSNTITYLENEIKDSNEHLAKIIAHQLIAIKLLQKSVKQALLAEKAKHI